MNSVRIAASILVRFSILIEKGEKYELEKSFRRGTYSNRRKA